MESKPLEVYSEASNHAVVRMPGRRFPGSVVQGDTLASLLSLACDIQKRTRNVGDEELSDLSDELCDLLRGRLNHYEQTLRSHGIDLPYAKPREDDA